MQTMIRIGGILGGALLVTAAVGVVGNRSQPVQGQSPDVEARVTQLEERLVTLEARVQSLEAAAAAPVVSTPQPSAQPAVAAPPEPITLLRTTNVLSGASDVYVIYPTDASELVQGRAEVCAELYTRRAPGDAGNLRVQFNSVSGQNNVNAIIFTQITAGVECKEIMVVDANRVVITNSTIGNFNVQIKLKR